MNHWAQPAAQERTSPSGCTAGRVGLANLIARTRAGEPLAPDQQEGDDDATE